GLLLDTFVVRTVTVPAIAVLLGNLNWWPSKPPALVKKRDRQPEPPDEPPTEVLSTVAPESMARRTVGGRVRPRTADRFAKPHRSPARPVGSGVTY
ncbi:MMPL family transporter, partial [Mycolicibacterium pulveris]